MNIKLSPKPSGENYGNGFPEDGDRKAPKIAMVAEGLKKWQMIIEPLGSEPLTQIIMNDYRVNGELLKQLGLGIYKKE